jgi:hypothetical protein
VIAVPVRPGVETRTIDRSVRFTFGVRMVGMAFYAQSDGLSFSQEIPDLVVDPGDEIVLQPGFNQV